MATDGFCVGMNHLGETFFVNSKYSSKYPSPWTLIVLSSAFENWIHWAASSGENLLNCLWWECLNWVDGFGGNFKKYY